MDDATEVAYETPQNLIRKAGGYKCSLAKLVDCNDPVKNKLLDVLCFSLATFDRCKQIISDEGPVIEGPSGLKQNPAVVIAAKCSETILRYCEKLKLGEENGNGKVVVDSIMATVRGIQI